VFHERERCIFVYTTRGDVLPAVATKGTINAVLLLKLLFGTELFQAYFHGTFVDKQVWRNCVLMCQLLDEIIEHDHAQILDSNMPERYLTKCGAKAIDPNAQAQLKEITDQATSVCSWHADVIKYRTDIMIENIDIPMSAKK